MIEMYNGFGVQTEQSIGVSQFPQHLLTCWSLQRVRPQKFLGPHMKIRKNEKMAISRSDDGIKSCLVGQLTSTSNLESEYTKQIDMGSTDLPFWDKTNLAGVTAQA